MLDHLQPLALDLGQIAPSHDLRHPKHTVERRADLVAHVGEELGFQGIRLFGRVFCFRQVGQAVLQALLIGLQVPEQGVEVPGEPAEFVIGAHLDAGRKVAVQSSGLDAVVQDVERPQSPPRQGAREEDGHQRGEQAQRQGDLVVAHEPVVDLDQMGPEDEFADASYADEIGPMHLQKGAAEHMGRVGASAGPGVIVDALRRHQPDAAAGGRKPDRGDRVFAAVRQGAGDREASGVVGPIRRDRHGDNLLSQFDLVRHQIGAAGFPV